MEFAILRRNKSLRSSLIVADKNARCDWRLPNIFRTLRTTTWTRFAISGGARRSTRYDVEVIPAYAAALYLRRAARGDYITGRGNPGILGECRHMSPDLARGERAAPRGGRRSYSAGSKQIVVSSRHTYADYTWHQVPICESLPTLSPFPLGRVASLCRAFRLSPRIRAFSRKKSNASAFLMEI